MESYNNSNATVAGGQHLPTTAHARSDGEGSPLDKGPLSNLGFLKNLSPDKKQTKDGQPPKRRGPKPDSKPALTRRQELNRQAQRTHRERKEMYIKALEQEVLRLKELFAHSTRERDAIAEENRKLREVLAQHGIKYDFAASPIQFKREGSGPRSVYGPPSTSGSISGSYRGTDSGSFSPPRAPNQVPPPLQMPPPTVQGQPYGPTDEQQRNLAQLPSTTLDFDQIGIDFVLTLERPCMDHMQYLLVRSHNQENQFFHHPMENPDDMEHEHMSGHALMATAPPHSHILERPAEEYPHQMIPELGSGDLSKLLNLSSRLPLGSNGEITPIMAWTQIFGDARVGELTKEDLERIKNELAGKVHCYGFGAVLEDFEVRDALSMVFAEKDNTVPSAVVESFSAQRIVVH